MAILELNPVNNSDYEYLYELLKERTPQINITHKNMPTWEQHVEFWNAVPYKEAYIIHESSPMGLIYFSKRNEVGIFIEEIHHHQGIGKDALELLLAKHRDERILANVNPQNQKSINFFLQFGFKHIQNTYEYHSSRQRS